jgi:hypothetical protein
MILSVAGTITLEAKPSKKADDDAVGPWFPIWFPIRSKTVQQEADFEHFVRRNCFRISTLFRWVENCKTFMRRFDPDPRLRTSQSSSKQFCVGAEPPSLTQYVAN